MTTNQTIDGVPRDRILACLNEVTRLNKNQD